MTLRVPPLDSETCRTGELWSKSNLKTKGIAIFFFQQIFFFFKNHRFFEKNRFFGDFLDFVRISDFWTYFDIFKKQTKKNYGFFLDIFWIFFDFFLFFS